MCFPFDAANVSNEERKASIVNDYKKLVESAGYALLHGGSHVEKLKDQADRLQGSMCWAVPQGTFHPDDWQSMEDAIQAARTFGA